MLPNIRAQCPYCGQVKARPYWIGLISCGTDWREFGEAYECPDCGKTFDKITKWGLIKSTTRTSIKEKGAVE